MKKVEQYVHANQFHLYGEGEDCLQSYNSLVVKISNGKITLGCDWDYSTTTSKHVYQFLEDYANFYIPYGKNKREYIRKAIQNGEIDYDATME